MTNLAQAREKIILCHIFDIILLKLFVRHPMLLYQGILMSDQNDHSVGNFNDAELSSIIDDIARLEMEDCAQDENVNEEKSVEVDDKTNDIINEIFDKSMEMASIREIKTEQKDPIDFKGSAQKELEMTLKAGERQVLIKIDKNQRLCISLGGLELEVGEKECRATTTGGAAFIVPLS